MKVRIRAILLFSLACLTAVLGKPEATANNGFQQVGSRYFQTGWTTDNGLPQNSVSSIIQTRDGYLWLTTLDGLVRYNGVQFTIFNKGNTPGIINNRFTALFEDHEGRLWIGTYQGGFSYKDGVFTSYAEKDGLADYWVWAIYADIDGNPLFLTERGIFKWTGGEFAPYISPDRLSDRVYSYATRFGGLSFYDATGLHVFEGGAFKTYAQKDGLSSLNVTSIYQDQAGALWITTKEARLYKLKDGRISDYDVRWLAGGPAIASVCEDRWGNIWIADASGGLSLLKAGALIERVEIDALRGKKVEKIYEDREGTIWVGTYNDGLYKLSKQAITIYSEQDGLSLNNVYPIYEDRQGSIWIGTWGGGLNKYKDGKFTRYTTRDGLAHDYVSAIGEDGVGGLWVGTRGGLNCLKDGKFVSFYNRGNGLPDVSVNVIHTDQGGTLWIGTNAGLVKYENGAFTTYAQKEGLLNKAIRVICEDRAGDLWIGTLGGLHHFRAGAVTAYTEKEGLSSNHVRSIYEDSDGVLWIGTYDGGLNRFKEGKFINYTVRTGLFDNGVFQILEDGKGSFWMSSNRGIFRASKQQLNDFAEGRIQSIVSIPYGKSDGMLNIECNGDKQPAGIRASDGRLLFPTQGGVAVITPEAIALNQQPPPVVIEECQLDRENVDFRSAIQIQPAQQSLEIHYAGLSFLKPEYVRFKYKLDGLDDDWIDAGTRRVAYYSRIPPGSYTFRVIAANSDGFWNQEGASLSIVVIPPFWQTWWFRLMSFAAIAGFALITYTWRVTALKRKHAAQEAFSRQLIESQENERKRIAAELHDSLGQSLVIIKNWSLLGLGLTAERHPFREQLQEISQTASRAIEEVREIAYNLRPYELERVGITETIRDMINRVASSSEIRFSIDIAPLDGLLSKEAEISLYRIVQEAVSNVVKHSEATEAKLVIKTDSARLHVTMEDNGKGIAAAPAAVRSQKRGFGLTGMAERVRMLKGSFAIDSSPGQGTRIDIRVAFEGQ